MVLTALRPAPAAWQLAVAAVAPVFSAACAALGHWQLGQVASLALLAVMLEFTLRRMRRPLSPSLIWVAFGFLMGAVVARVGAQTAPIYQPGNGVTLPRVISEVKAHYTEEAKAARIEGTVILSTVVLADGRVRDVDVAVSLDEIKIG